jgi:1,2-phenylacetyl-CoA epoxidase PaaB subunit
MALAKEQYGRRGETSNLWVVCSADVLEMDYADEDVFRTTPSKSYRDPAGYKVNDKIDAYKAKNQG